MENFISYNPTKVIFGKNVIGKLSENIGKYGKKILLVYGKGSIKNNGIYDNIISELSKNSFEIYEYSGIKSNPIIDDVRDAIKLGKQKKVDVVLAVGGGSVIDSAKIISLGIMSDDDAWDIMKYKVKVSKALPIICVLTLAATGTEMNSYAVVQNHETNEKIGFGNKLMSPTISFLDPSYTISVSKNYTAYGIVDLISHSLESYFGNGEAPLSDKFVYSIINEAIESGLKLVENLEDYKLRANIMWASTCALNGLTGYGRENEDWGVHGIGHVLSLLYDVPHGASLSIVYPAWLKHHKEAINNRLIDLGINVFKTNTADETIIKIEELFSNLGSPIRLNNLKNNSIDNNEIFDALVKNKATGYNHKLNEADYKNIIYLMQ